jgi:N-acetylmuramoyl-L-alanine amidase
MRDMLKRGVWEQPGMRIGEHTNSGPQELTAADYLVIHYTGAPSTPERYDDVVAFLQRTQREYVATRGYSIGYNWVVDRTDRIWEARGIDYRCAANGNTETNRRGPAILCMVNGDEPAGPLMIEAVRTVVDFCQTQAGRPLNIVGHRDVRATSCPGDGLYQQIQTGVFKPLEDTMQPLVRPRRVYDSRNASAGRLARGQWRQILVGRDQVHAHITVVDPDGAGYLAMCGDSTGTDSSLVNFAAGQTAMCGAPIATIDGRIRVIASANCDVIVDIYAESPT